MNIYEFVNIHAFACITYVIIDNGVIILPRRDEAIQRVNKKSEEIKTVETVTGSTLRTNHHSL